MIYQNRTRRMAIPLALAVSASLATPRPAPAFDEGDVRAMVLNEVRQDQYPGQPAVWMGRHRDVRMDGVGNCVILEHWVVRVFDPGWAEKRFSPFGLSYWSANQGVHLDRVRIWRGEAPPREVSRAECTEDRRNPGVRDENAAYIPLRELTVQVPKVQSGDVIELLWRLVDNVAQGELNTRAAVYEFGAAEPVIEELLSISTPTALELHHVDRGDGVHHRTQEHGDSKEDTWVSGNLPSSNLRWNDFNYAKTAVPATPGDSLASPPPRVTWSVLNDWRWVATYYGRRWEFHASQRSSIISLKVSQITAGATSDLDKATRIERWVQENIGVLDESADLLGLRPRDASEIILADVATPRDKALLLYSMLRAAGLRGTPALVHARGGSWDDEIVAPGALDHFLVRLALPGGDVLWLDAQESKTALPAGFALLLPPQGEDSAVGLEPFPGRSGQN